MEDKNLEAVAIKIGGEWYRIDLEQLELSQSVLNYIQELLQQPQFKTLDVPVEMVNKAALRMAAYITDSITKNLQRCLEAQKKYGASVDFGNFAEAVMKEPYLENEE